MRRQVPFAIDFGIKEAWLQQISIFLEIVPTHRETMQDTGSQFYKDTQNHKPNLQASIGHVADVILPLLCLGCSSPKTRNG